MSFAGSCRRTAGDRGDAAVANAGDTQDADLGTWDRRIAQLAAIAGRHRHREAHGHATLFVPTAAFKISVFPIADAPVRWVKLDGRIANIVSLAPRR